jgi:3-hydroxybutyryl-CoA dehydrogenase
MEIKKVVVVGAGMMGNALAQVFASNPKLAVTLRTRSLKDDRWDPIISNLDIMIARGAGTEAEKKAILSRISFSTDDAEAYSDADFVIECYPEEMETKQNLFCLIEKFCRKDCIWQPTPPS